MTGRVTDAALVVGPGMWRFGWTGDDLDELAGAVVAGHIIECGCQATGGNYAFFGELPGLAQAGFPLVELAADGSCVVTKHPGTGGQVSVGTVTAQLLYEIGGPAYLNPDVTARFDTIALRQAGPDRVRVSGVRGEPPPANLKVSLNYAGGYRNSMILSIEGLDVAAKARLAEQTIWARVDGGRDAFETADVELVGSDPALLRISVLDQDKAKVGRAFSAAVVETGAGELSGVLRAHAAGRRLDVRRVLAHGRSCRSGAHHGPHRRHAGMVRPGSRAAIRAGRGQARPRGNARRAGHRTTP